MYVHNKLGEDMENKIERVHLRLTIEEKQILMREAKKEGLTLSEYIRNKSLNRRKVKSPSKRKEVVKN